MEEITASLEEVGKVVEMFPRLFLFEVHGFLADTLLEEGAVLGKFSKYGEVLSNKRRRKVDSFICI